MEAGLREQFVTVESQYDIDRIEKLAMAGSSGRAWM